MVFETRTKKLTAQGTNQQKSNVATKRKKKLARKSRKKNN